MAYDKCFNLSGEPVCGPNVTNLYATYRSCYNLTGNMYILSDNVQNAALCFDDTGYIANNCNETDGGCNCYPLNIYVNKNTTSLESFIQDGAFSICGSSMEWSKPNDDVWYSSRYLITICAVDNVRDYMK